jgi:hypothetical protein
MQNKISFETLKSHLENDPVYYIQDRKFII